MDIKEQILALAKRPDGMQAADVEGFDSGYVSAKCHDMADKGLLHKVKVSHKRVRWYTDQGLAIQAQREADARMVAEENKRIKLAGSKARFDADAKIVITSKTKITVCPPWKPRFEALGAGFILTANQSGRVRLDEKAAA